MQIHGNVLTSDEAGIIAELDRLASTRLHGDPLQIGNGQFLRFCNLHADTLLALHYRLAARVAEQDRELTRIKSLIEAAGGEHSAGFDWSMLGRIDELETALTAAREELAGTPPTLEWLVSVFGPGDDRGGAVIWSKGLRLIYHYKADQRTESQQDGVSEWESLRTRAAVLAAVAAAKEQA